MNDMKNYLFLFIGIMLVACSSKEEKVIESKSETSSSNHKGLPNLPKEMMFCGQKINLEDEIVVKPIKKNNTKRNKILKYSIFPIVILLITIDEAYIRIKDFITNFTISD